jgi:hypothetical protein
MVERKFTHEGARKALQDAEWANGIGVAHAAMFTLTLTTDAPLQIKVLTFAGFLAAGINGARRGMQEGQAMGEHAGIEF